MKTARYILLIAILVASMTAVAQAASLFTYGSTGELPSPSGVIATFSAGSGPGNVNFQIQGYRTLDGLNCCTDTFHLYVNGTELITGTWDLGGGGQDVVYLNADGATINHSGQGVDISAPVTFVNGLNTVDFEYTGEYQGLGDEAWGLNHIDITGNEVSTPEPATLALLLTGLGAGLAAHRKKAR